VTGEIENQAEGETGSTTEDQIPPDKRRDARERDRHRCRIRGEKGPGAGGVATLQVHHIEDDPDDYDKHDLANLITVCESCHSWIHKRPTAEDMPESLDVSDDTPLLPHDFEILQVLHEQGPATISEIAEAITPEYSQLAVRERLLLLMGLDNIVPTREQQLIDHDVETRQWGLPHQITHSARGRIPDDVQTLIQRIEDERVRRALERGCDRETVAAVFDIHPRTTRTKERRAAAYDFPLDALRDGRSASPTDDASEQTSSQSVKSDATTASESGSTHQLTAGTERVETRTEQAAATASDASSGQQALGVESNGDNMTEESVSVDRATLKTQLEQAIGALEMIETEL
jgi:hypothetical protein